ncbi:uncharacterized protein [Nicotiana sylvestris]|uniref:uncharacterized protein n=1 Tax=Nicotiana sylvestris TaxID=4096 RepID=UPI00388C860B
MKVQDYSNMKQLRKTPAQISLLSLLIHLDEHRRALMKILNEAHVPDKILVNHLEKIANKIFKVNKVTFFDDKLPMEGTEHNRALYLTLKVDDERIHKNNICVRGFDGGKKDSVGDIVLELTIGPVEFTIEFQVLDVAVSYNLLLGRPWIHAAKVVPSTLHQMVKFKWDRQEIVVHGKDNLCAHSNASILFIEVEDNKGPWVYQVFETVSVKKGIIQPVSLPKNLGTFGLGFKPIAADMKRAKRLKHKVWVLPKPISRLSRSFVKPGARKCPMTTVPSSVDDIDEELIERFRRLFDDVNLVEKLRKFKTDMSVKIKEEITKQLDSKVILVTQYPTWLTNVVSVPKKDGKTRVCVNYRDLNKILMDEKDAKKTTFITPWGTYCYSFMPFGLKNAGEAVRPRQRFEKVLPKAPQEAFDEIKGYLSNPTVLVPPKLGRPLILYLTVLDNSFGCVLGQYDITCRKEQAINYLSKKFTSYEVKYTPLERTCCTLNWVAQKLKHYLLSYTTYLISRLDPLKYIFQNPMPRGRLTKWQILLMEFDIVYVTRTTIKAQDLADHLAEKPVDEEYEPLKTYFPNEEVMYIDKVKKEEKPDLKLLFNGAANMKGVGIGAVLISEIGHHYPVTAQLCFYCTNNMAEYEACILGLSLAVTMGIQEVLVLGDSDLLHAYCNVVEEELDGEPWFHDIREYIRKGLYPVQATSDQKRTIRRLANEFFFTGGVLYKRTPDLGLLRCIDARQATTIMTEGQKILFVSEKPSLKKASTRQVPT